MAGPPARGGRAPHPAALPDRPAGARGRGRAGARRPPARPRRPTRSRPRRPARRRKAVRTAARRALYRLRQAGVVSPSRGPGARDGSGRARGGVGVRGRRHRRPGPLAHSCGSLRGAHPPGGGALGRGRPDRLFRCAAIRRSESRSACRRCRPRVRCPGWRSRHAGPGPPSWRPRSAPARRAAPCPRSSAQLDRAARRPAPPSPPPIHARLPAGPPRTLPLLERSAALLAASGADGLVPGSRERVERVPRVRSRPGRVAS